LPALTAVARVSRIYTDLAVIDIGATGLTLIDKPPGLSYDELQRRTGAPLFFGDDDGR
jgi:3-oxoadipate CoA-transferase, beta subunit